MADFNRTREPVLTWPMKMVFGFLVILFLFCCLIAQAALGIEANSTTYTIDSYHLGSGGNNATSLSYTSRTTITYQQGGSNVSAPTYIGNIGHFPEEEQNATFITLLSPTNGQIVAIANNSIPIRAQAIDQDGLSNASLWTNTTGVWALNGTQNASGVISQNNFTLAVINGDYLWNVEYCDALGNCNFNTLNFTFKQNVQPTGGGGGGAAPADISRAIEVTRDFIQELLDDQLKGDIRSKNLLILFVLVTLYSIFIFGGSRRKRKDSEKVRKRIIVR